MGSSTSIPLPTSCKGLTASPRTREVLKNLIYAENELVLRPGVTQKFQGFGNCRGFGKFRNRDTGEMELYAVSGPKLIRITIIKNRIDKELLPEDILVEEIGDIDGNGECLLIGGFTQLLILEVGSNGYIYPKSDSEDEVVKITDPNFLPSDSAAYDRGRFVFVPTNGSEFFWSKLDDAADIDVQDFQDADISADPNRAVYYLNNSIYILGSETTQRFSYNAELDTYVPSLSEGYQVGFVGGLQSYNETFVFIGQRQTGGLDVYVMTGQGPAPISNGFISEFLNSNYSLIELKNAKASVINWKGVPVVVFDLPRHTLCFFGTGWSFWQSGVSGPNIKTWRIGEVLQAYNYYWTGDSNSNSIGILEDTGQDYGGNIESGIQTFARGLKNSNFLVKKIELGVTTGSTEGQEPQIALWMSPDGKTFDGPHYNDLGYTGEYNKPIYWGPSIGRYYDGFTVLITCYGKAVVNVGSLQFER